MDHFLTEEQQMIVDIAREIANEKIIPKRVELDEKNEFPTSILQDMAKADLFGIFIPEQYGGFGGGCFEIVLALEELSRGCVGVATSYAASALGIFPVLIAGGVLCVYSMLNAFFGLPIPSFNKSQFNPSIRAAPGWQLAQLCQF